MPAGYEVYLSHGSRTLASRCRDISPKGMGLVTSDPVADGAPLDLNAVIPEGAINLSLSGFVRHCQRRPEVDPARPYLVGIEFSELTKENFPFLQLQGDTLTHRHSHTVRIESDPQSCYRWICAYERYPEWVKFFESHTVKETYPDGRPRLVTWNVNAYVRRVGFTLEYSYDDRNLSLSWVSPEGDLLENTGRWRFSPFGDRETSATFDLCVRLNIPAPPRLLNYFSTVAMGKGMRDFARFVQKNQPRKK
jgi:hypothetical protein